MRILVINGPNLNMLGIREPELYGKKDYAALCAAIEEHAVQLGVAVDVFQSNCEGEIVTRIQQALGREDAVVINAAAYTHTSIAILDALKAVALPAVEVHLTEPMQREDFRRVSYTGMACEARFAGFDFESYLKALDYLHQKYVE
ncbi:MAG: 3-dehydroquinate dehydratase [Clostridia bacterium]|nr:3-dehydroquinate dehydratase [Clostridia bacterium]